MEMGHGDELVLADTISYRPAEVIHVDGHGVPVTFRSSSTEVLPLDTYSSYQAGLMQVVPGDQLFR